MNTLIDIQHLESKWTGRVAPVNTLLHDGLKAVVRKRDELLIGIKVDTRATATSTGMHMYPMPQEGLTHGEGRKLGTKKFGR